MRSMILPGELRSLPSSDSNQPDEKPQLRAIIDRISKEREIYFAAIEHCGGKCKTYCIEHVEEEK